MSWRQTVEKQGDAPNFTKQLLPLKVKGLLKQTFLFCFFLNFHDKILFQRVRKLALALNLLVIQRRLYLGIVMVSWLKTPKTLKLLPHQQQVHLQLNMHLLSILVYTR